MAVNIKVSSKLRLRVVTPTKTAFDEEVDMVVLSTVDGEIGVLIGHEPLTTLLGFGVMKIYNDETVKPIAIFGGFAEINTEGATIVADIAEHPKEIDAERARQAKERAEARLSSRDADLDIQRAQVALRKSLVRLELSGIPLTSAKKH